MAAGKIKTYLEMVDARLGGGIKKNNVTLISGHEKSARTRTDLCHRFCVISQLPEEDGAKEKFMYLDLSRACSLRPDKMLVTAKRFPLKEKVMYLDFSRACSLRPDKMLVTAKMCYIFPLHGDNVLKNVTYGRISRGEISNEQNKLYAEAIAKISNDGRFGLLIVNAFPIDAPNFTPAALNALAMKEKITIIVNNNDGQPHDDEAEEQHDDTKSVYIEVSKDEVQPVEFEMTHLLLNSDEELKFPTKGMTGATIATSIEQISSSNGSLWCALELWNVATNLRKVYKKKTTVQIGMITAFIHMSLCATAFILEQLKEFKWPESRSLSIAGLVVATFGALFWGWEIKQKWASREHKWFMWPFFPATVGLIVEVNQVAFYVACLAHPGKPPRLVFSAILFHVSHIIKLMAKDKRKNIKNMRLGSEV